MNKPLPFLSAVIAWLLLSSTAVVADESSQQEKNLEDGKLRIIVFGAHPDDAEYRAGGCGAKWAKLGHHVKLVSVTNGDIGHWAMSGGALAKRRTAEVHAAAKILGTTAEVLDIHDGELMPTLENRRTITRLIREWNADIVIAHRPWDYHPDHRYVGILVQDAAFMVTVPFFCPDVPPLKKNPVFLYASDRFKKPYPFTPDIAVSVDDVFETKVRAVTKLESQVFDGGALGNAEKAAEAPPARMTELRIAKIRESWNRRQSGEANAYRDTLVKLYGEKRGKEIKYAEVFEICEYGHQPSASEIKTLFPFFDEPEPAGDEAKDAAAAKSLSEAEAKLGWQSLFDGKTTNGWRGFRSDSFPHQWKVVEGAITRTTTSPEHRQARTDLMTRGQYRNFRLQLDWKIQPGGNGGIFLRLGEDVKLAWHGAPEVQLLDDAAIKDLGNDRRNGACYGLYAAEQQAVRPPGQWNQMTLVADGAHLEHWLNGVKIVEYEIGSDDWNRRVGKSKFSKFPSFGKRSAGHICLQDYGDEIAFRNIRILEIPSEN